MTGKNDIPSVTTNDYAASFVTPEVIDALMDFKWKHSTTIPRVSDVPVEWSDLWCERFGKGWIDNFLAKLGQIGGVLFHDYFYRVSLSHSRLNKSRTAIDLAMALCDAHTAVAGFSERNRPWAFLLLISGVEMSVLRRWDEGDMSNTIIARYDQRSIEIIDVMVMHDVDAGIIDALYTPVV